MLDEEKFYGKYRGYCKDINDPQKLGRIRAEVPAVLGKGVLSDWCEVCIVSRQSLDTPPVGTGVWVEFEAGDKNKPIFVGCWLGIAAGKLDTPDTAVGARDETSAFPKGRESISIGEDEEGNNLFIQFPGTKFNASYGKNKVFKTESGHIIEIDDTPGNERLHIYHKKSSYFEFDRKGGINQRSAGNCFVANAKNKTEITNEDKVSGTKGNSNETVGKTKTVKVTKDYKTTVNGKKETTVNSDSSEKIGGGKIFECAGGLTISIGGKRAEVIAGSRTVNVMANSDETILEFANLQIANKSQSENARKVTIATGNYFIDIKKGDIKFQTLLGNIELTTLSGDITVTTATGKITFSALQEIVFNAPSIKLGSQAAIFPVVTALTPWPTCPFGISHLVGSPVTKSM